MLQIQDTGRVQLLNLSLATETSYSYTEAAPAVLKWSGQEVGGAMSSGGCG